MIKKAQADETVTVAWSINWPTIEELHTFADENNLSHTVKVQMDIIGGQVRICLRGANA